MKGGSELLSSYPRRQSLEVGIGNLPLGGRHPLRIQTMTTTDTLNVDKTVEQIQILSDAGAEYVRLTVPSLKEAAAVHKIKDRLVQHGYSVPLIADVHFTPRVAEELAGLVEKIRINPGNYADKKLFKNISYTEESYQHELIRIRDRFLPLVHLCKRHGTAMRIGTNHGSLSDRIMSRYGDTPKGMVESALEFVKICRAEAYDSLVLSMKASHVQVMVHAYRLLVSRLEEEQLPPYPLHLGVTEAGDGLPGRIKSAIGIGCLLEEGIGDTIRVSLTERSEKEIPVAQSIAAKYKKISTWYKKWNPISPPATPTASQYNPFVYQRRKSLSVPFPPVGGKALPVVVADFTHKDRALSQEDFKAMGYHYLSAQEKWILAERACDLVLLTAAMSLPRGLHGIIPFGLWQRMSVSERASFFPWMDSVQMEALGDFSGPCFLRTSVSELEKGLAQTSGMPTCIALVDVDPRLAYGRIRAGVLALETEMPIIWRCEVSSRDLLPEHASLGACFLDGFGDGISLWSSSSGLPTDLLCTHAFELLQAARVRTSKTEYIACPSCGRTLFDLEETTARIRQKTSHLKGLKIGIMGCIVNGPGEMADADYGYVGSGKGKITLYKGKEIVRRGIPEQEAVEELIDLIKKHGDWVSEPSAFSEKS
ncbi:MAG: (E)-4-hydroxy-3-methylbut-2-enyl-diphosphate synthase [Cytophagales bacterium]|nr:(E)-4-hydroxy-3-methylbut-2-enyl-diphosphate synthase [Cytophagales bacterium]